ncbi:hypothetical protein FWH30_00475 [Microgenomates group bacterium]|nr:hypothetical protein [Microgenomates group bacterium]
MRKFYRIFLVVVMVFLLGVGSLHLWRGDIWFHADVARDFLVMDEMVETGKLTLIGPKSGGIAGVFHGPAWYYLNLPMFVMVGGSPAAMGVWWMVMYVASLGVSFYLIKKRQGMDIALLATTLLMCLTVFLAGRMLQSTPAMFLIMPSWYCLSEYLASKKARWLLGGVFLLGMMVQFQMALGVPVLLGVGLYLVYFMVKNKLWRHLWCLGIMLIPLSTFVVFDLRHDFLQTRSAVRYLAEGDRDNSEAFELINYLRLRGQALVGGFTLLPFSSQVWRGGGAMAGIILVVASGRLLMEREEETEVMRASIWLGLLMVGSFWIFTIPFRGEIRSYYYDNLWPIICLLAAMAIDKYKALKILAMGMIVVNVGRIGIMGADYWKQDAKENIERWTFYGAMARDVMENAEGKEFGYFAWTADQLGYGSKYAMKYWGKRYDMVVYPYEKREITYLLIAPNEATYNPDANPDYWQKSQVRIEREADGEWKYESDLYQGDGFRVKRYNLDEEERGVAADENLIKGLEFR